MNKILNKEIKEFEEIEDIDPYIVGEDSFSLQKIVDLTGFLCFSCKNLKSGIDIYRYKNLKGEDKILDIFFDRIVTHWVVLDVTELVDTSSITLSSVMTDKEYEKLKNSWDRDPVSLSIPKALGQNYQ